MSAVLFPVKILIVDDLKANLLALEGLLRRDDLQIVEAQSGAIALEQLMQHEFALALIDVQMPLMNGYELAELMRGVIKTKAIPIIFITATSDDRAYLFKGYESGAVDILLKPLDRYAVRSKVAVFIDLYRQNKKLSIAEVKFRGLLEMAPDAMIISDEQGIIEIVNKKAEILFGYERAEIIGQSTHMLMPERFRQEHGLNPEEYPPDLCGLRKDRSEFSMELSLSPLITDQGTLVSAAIRDVSARRSADKRQDFLLAELRKTQIELKKSLKVRDEFMATLSHELRTPLTAILSWAQLLVRGDLDAKKTKRALEIIERSARDQGQLIDDLLDVARIQTGKLGIEKKYIDPIFAIRSAVDSVQGVAKIKSIEIISEIASPIKKYFC